MTKKEDAWERIEEIKDDVRKLNILMEDIKDFETMVGTQRLINILNAEKKQLKKDFYIGGQ